MRVKWTWGGNANGAYGSLRPDRFDGLSEAVIYAGLFCKRACTLMGDGLDAVRFIYSNADLSSADIDCNSVAHNTIITEPLPAFPKYVWRLEMTSLGLLLELGSAQAVSSIARGRCHDVRAFSK